MMLSLTIIALLLGPATGFVAPRARNSFVRPDTTLFAISKSDLTGIGYTVRVEKPLGVVFGENPEPYLGLTIDDVESGSKGGMAGLRVGHQLLCVGDEVVIGDDFDSAMGLLRAAPSTIELQLYKGTARQLYTILNNKLGNVMDDDEPEVIMDENYESPVRVPIDGFEEEEPLNAKDFFNGLKKIAETAVPKGDGKKGGLFGGMFSQETIQLEGDEASGTK